MPLSHQLLPLIEIEFVAHELNLNVTESCDPIGVIE